MTLLPDAAAAAGESRGASAAGSAAPARSLDHPSRAAGLELIGEVAGSGYREPPALVRRADGQTIQLTPLLYLVLKAVDGERSHDEIAALVSRWSGRDVTPGNVETLCARLRELGTLRRVDGTEPQLRRANPLLALRLRYVVSDPDVTSRLTAPFAVLFAPVVVALVSLAFAAVCVWVLFVKGLASATHNAFHQPGLLLLVFLLTVVSAGFHEFGHAAAARYGGARPGAMGTGLYLVWPAFYTDVTDSYRLGRAGRVRTDLGGLYFNAMVAVAMFAVWWATRWDAILLIIATQVLQMVRQLAPLVRFDGYHVLADLTGVPDLYHRIRPTLTGVLPARWRSPEAGVLKPWARAVVTVWVLVVVPVLLATLLLMVLSLPRVLATAWSGLGEQSLLLSDRFAHGDVLGVLARVLGIVAIAFPVLASLLLVVRTSRQLVTKTWRATRGHPARRAGAAVVAAAVVAGLLWAWWPDPGTYRPIQAYERGAVQDSAPAWFASATPSGLVQGRSARAVTLWPQGRPLPTAEKPALAVVMVPHAARTGAGSGAGGASGSAPTWVFPFDRPAAPGAGDNQALAVNTTDGGTVYDVALALVWAQDDMVLNTNEAYAFASCTGCRTVAVAFQVILIAGDARVVVPQNLSGAVNYTCMECLTYALAKQLVVTVPTPLDSQSLARLNAVWAQVAAFGASIEGLPLTEIQARLTDFEAAILQAVGVKPDPAPKVSTTTDPSGTTSTTAPSGASPSSAVTSSGAPAAQTTGSSSPDSSTTPSSAPPTTTTTEPAAGDGASPSSQPSGTQTAAVPAPS